VTDWQQNEHIADIGGYNTDVGAIEVCISRWPGYPGGKNPQVSWLTAGRFHYLSPHLARKFAAALIDAANRIEGRDDYSGAFMADDPDYHDA
jgi:hypothetical protein